MDPHYIFTLEFRATLHPDILPKKNDKRKQWSIIPKIQPETERWSDRSWNGAITETCGLYCTQQLVGVNRNEHATLSAQSGLEMLAVNREAGRVPVLSGDWGSSGMWDSHHLASFTPIPPENQPWPHLRMCVCVCVHLCACEQYEQLCKRHHVVEREKECVCKAGWGEADCLNIYWKLAEERRSLDGGAGYALRWRTYCVCLLHRVFKINELQVTWNEINSIISNVILVQFNIINNLNWPLVNVLREIDTTFKTKPWDTWFYMKCLHHNPASP